MANQYEFSQYPDGEWRRLPGVIDGEMAAVIRAAEIIYEGMEINYSDSFYLSIRKFGDSEFNTFYVSATVHVEYFWRKARSEELKPNA